MVSTRHPHRPLSALPLSDSQAETQKQRGLYTTHRGVPLPIPVDRISQPTVFLRRDLWRQDSAGRIYRPGSRMTAPGTQWQRRVLEFLRDRVNPDIPSLYYRAVLGHDLHVSTWGNLYARHFHAGWANPFEPDKVDAPLARTFEHDCDKPKCELRGNRVKWFGDSPRISIFESRWGGFIEDCGWLSGAKVTTAFRDFEIDALEVASTTYDDYDFHEVGTGSTAEANTQTALVTSTGIARVSGTPSQPAADQYRSVGTITADTTETWSEHGLFNASSGVTLMDRSLTGGQAVNSSDQVQYTYTITKAAEA